MSECGHRGRRSGIVAALILVVTAVAAGRAVAALPPAPDALPQLWAVEVDGKTLRSLDRPLLRQVRTARVTLLAAPRLSARDRRRLASLSEASQVPAIHPRRIRQAGVARMASAASAACRRVKRARLGSRCGLRFPGRRVLGRLSRTTAADLVVVPVRAQSLRRLRAAPASSRVLGVIGLPRRSVRSARVRAAVGRAARDPRIDLAVRPKGSHRGRALRRYLALLARRVHGDRSPPSAPPRLRASRTRPRSVSLAWPAARDNRRVTGYGLYRAGVFRSRSSRRSTVFAGLRCQDHVFEVDAVDRAGNRSRKRSLVAAPDGCGSSDTPPRAADPSRRYPDEGTPPSRFVAPDGSDAGSCSERAPCASFDRANRAAAPGEVVQVAGGTYPEQTMTAVPGRAGPNVVFRPAPAASVKVQSLNFEGSDFITMRRMSTAYKPAEPGAGNQEGIWVGPGSTHITLQEMDAGSIDSWFADHLTVTDGDFGPCQAIWGADNVCGNSKQDASTNVLIDGATFHDYRFDESCFTSGADCHWECMYVNGSKNVTIRNSKFRQCAIFDIFATISGPDAAQLGHDGLLIENNWFGAPYTESAGGGSPSRPTAVSLAWCQNSPKGYKNTTVRFNSFARNTQLQIDPNPSCVFDNVKVVGNLSMWDGCQPRWTWQYNVWSTSWRTGSCGPTDKIHGAQLPYVEGSSQPSMNYHLTGARSAADNLVPVSVGCPATDIDGQRRGANGFCDAGSDER